MSARNMWKNICAGNVGDKKDHLLDCSHRRYVWWFLRGELQKRPFRVENKLYKILWKWGVKIARERIYVSFNVRIWKFASWRRFWKTAVSTSFSNILETLSEAVHQNRFSGRHEVKAERGRRPKIDEPGANENPTSSRTCSHSARNGKARGYKRARVSKNSNTFPRKLHVAKKYNNY